ncbi:MAG: hypothetical protein AAFX65_09440 [Cyanobacteria bacterium J06638_7]
MQRSGRGRAARAADGSSLACFRARICARVSVAAVLAIGLAACGSAARGPFSAAPGGSSSIPASLAPFGDGYPAAGDPCRRLGESEATADFLDHRALLVGCADAEAAAALGGRVVATVEGITLVSIPLEDGEGGDALVPGAVDAFRAGV